MAESYRWLSQMRMGRLASLAESAIPDISRGSQGEACLHGNRCYAGKLCREACSDVLALPACQRPCVRSCLAAHQARAKAVYLRHGELGGERQQVLAFVHILVANLNQHSVVCQGYGREWSNNP